MTEEKWMYTPGARSTLTRLEHLVGSARTIEVPAERPSNSTVKAGWICCGLGVLCAWLLPVVHLFFVVAFILAIIAMSTHQVRQGTILLVTTVVCATLTILAWLGLVAAVGVSLFDRVRHSVERPVPYTSQAIQPDPATSQSGSRMIISAPAVPVATLSIPGSARPVITMDELSMLLRTGYGDDEVIAATQSRQLAEPLNGAQANALRLLGASEKLIINLRARPIDYSTRRVVPTFTPIPVVAAVPYVAPAPTRQNTSAVATGSVATNYQEKDRRIQDLKTRMEALDDDVRRIRTNPQDYRYRWRDRKSVG